MAFDLWTHQFCLACDKQTDGAAYCSQSCRLADFEKSSTPSSAASSPSFAPQDCPWTFAAPKASAASTSPPKKFYVSPAYDFSTAQPYGRTPQPQPPYLSSSGRNNVLKLEPVPSTTSSRPRHPHHQPVRHQQPARSLTPSSSHSSLCSMQSASSTGSAAEGFQLSEKSRRELHAYHMNMEQARLQRRRSY